MVSYGNQKARLAQNILYEMDMSTAARPISRCFQSAIQATNAKSMLFYNLESGEIQVDLG